MKNKKGFTLVEIMIVVVIIGLLAAIGVPAFQKVREKTDEKAALNDLRQIAAAADQYFMEFSDASIDRDYLEDNYIKKLNDRYTYPDTIASDDISLTATLPSGETVDFEFRKATQ